MESGQVVVNSADVLVHGAIRLHLVSGHAEVAGVPVDLQPKQFHLLAYLIHHSGRPITSAELWSNVFRCRCALRGSHVRRQIMELRRRLGPAAVLLQTARSGYVLLSPADAAAEAAS
jgi:DNA-binding response OmpR family regulator